MAALEETFARFRSTGDPEALAEVYDATAARLLRAAVHLAPSPGAAEDLLQATFVAAIESRDAYDPARPLTPWLVGILANQAKLQRWREGRTPDPDRLRPRPSGDPVVQAAASEFTEAVDQAIAELPDVYQPVLVLHLRHGLAPAEIAHALRRPPGTVRAQLTRGFAKLRGVLPAGLASSVAVGALLPSTGLAGVRAAVLAHAATIPSTAAAGGLLIGAVAVKKLMIGVVAVATAGALVVLGAEMLAPEPGHLPGEEPVASTAPAPDTAPEPAPAPAPSRAPDTADRNPVAAVPAAQRPAPKRPPRGKAALHGTVLWENDRAPARGITIWCNAPAGHVADRRRAVTDAEGRFRFAGLPPAHYHVATDRGGEKSLSLRAGVRRTLQLVIPAASDVTGVVRDADRQPVAGAQIWVSEPSIVERGTVVGVTDTAGRYRIRSVSSRRFIGARAGGYRPSTLYFVQAEKGEVVDLDLELLHGDARVRGRVFDDAAQPVSGAVVRIAPPGRSPWVPTPGGITARGWSAVLVRSDADGAFEAHGLPPGRLSVQVRDADHATFRTEVTVDAGGVGRVSANLPRHGHVEGRVVDATGAPVRARVQSGVDWDDFAGTSTGTDADGRYSLPVTPGAVSLTVHAGGRAARRDTLQVAPGETVRWDFELRDRPAIVGRVVDAAHRPLPGWRVWLRRGGESAGSTRSDAMGRFEFPDLEAVVHTVHTGVPPDAPLSIHDAAITAASMDDVLPGDREITLEVPAGSMPSCAVRGRVRGPDGEVVGQTRIHVGHVDGRGLAVVKVDAQTGRFEIRDLVPGPYWITVRAEAFPWIRVGRRELEPGRELDLGDLRLDAGGAVAGQLHASDPADLQDVELRVLDSKGSFTGTVQREGHLYRSNALRPGDYKLVVRGPRTAIQSLPFRIHGGGDQQTLDVTLRPGAICHVRAELPPGAPAAEWVWLSLMRAGEIEVMAGLGLQQSAPGVWVVETRLTAGTYQAWVGSDHDHRGVGDVRVGPGGAPVSVRVALSANR